MPTITLTDTYDMAPGQLWQSFATEWHTVAEASAEVGATEVSEFFEELSHVAEDFSAEMGWPLPSAN